MQIPPPPDYFFYETNFKQEGPAPEFEVASFGGDCDCYGWKTKSNPTSHSSHKILIRKHRTKLHNCRSQSK